MATNAFRVIEFFLRKFRIIVLPPHNVMIAMNPDCLLERETANSK